MLEIQGLKITKSKRNLYEKNHTEKKTLQASIDQPKIVK